MAEPDSENAPEEASETTPAAQDEGPGWMPAIMAMTVLTGIFGFICCGVSTWVLYQQRSALAVRSLRGAVIPSLEQSYLEPEEKQAVLGHIDKLASELEEGKHENWQAAGVMQRLQRLPMLQWGELEAIEGFLRKSGSDDMDESLMDLSRLRRAVELGKATSFDVEKVLKPVLEDDPESPNGRRMIMPLTPEGVDAVVFRAKELADRIDIPDETYEVDLGVIVRREIEAGLNEGSY